MCTVLMKFGLYDIIDKALVVDQLMGEKNNYCLVILSLREIAVLLNYLDLTNLELNLNYYRTDAYEVMDILAGIFKLIHSRIYTLLSVFHLQFSKERIFFSL